MRIIEFAAKNSLLMNLLTMMLLIVGGYQLLNMRREAFPAIAVDYVWVQTQYPGAGPKEVERYVTDPLEKEIEKVDGIKRIDSSSAEGLSKITIELDPDRSELEKDRTVTDIQRAVDQAKDLPDRLPNPPWVHRLNSRENPVIDIALGGEIPYAELHDIVERYRDRIEDLPDVNDLKWRAERDPEFWVEADAAKMAAYQISFLQLQAALAAQNVNLPGGAFETAAGELLIRSVGELRTVEDIGNVVVLANASGGKVRVRDVATVSQSFSKETIRLRANGEPVVLLSATIDSSKGDIIRATRDIRNESEQFLKELNDPRLQISFVNDVSEFVNERLQVLASNGTYGLALVLLILLLFLSKGIAIITALGMPIAMLGTFLVMGYAGVTINLITMFAMILVIGMLVDDSIIVAENIWQRYEAGESPWQATINGAKEVALPIIATITTTIAAFAPMLMVSGIFGKFIRWLPIIVILMLTLSLIEALFVLPSHAHDVLRLRERWWRWRGKTVEQGRHESQPSRMKRWIYGVYESVLSLTLRWRYFFVLAIFALFGFSGWYAQNHMKLELFPNDQMEAFFIRAKLSPNASLNETTEQFKKIEALVAALPAHELENYVTYIGLLQNDPGDPFAETGSNIGQIAVYLTPYNSGRRSAFAIMDEIRAKMPDIAAVAGLTTWNLDMVRSGPPVGKPIAIQVRGDDYAVLYELAQKIRTLLEATPGTKDIAIDFTPGKDEVQINIDNAKAARALLTPSDISQQILAAYEGTVATYVREGGKRVPIRVKLRDDANRDIRELSRLLIANSAGRLVPLGDVATLAVQPGVRNLLHRDLFRTVGITANIDEKLTDSKRINEALAPELHKLAADYPGVFVKLGGEYEETENSMRSLKEAYAVALGLIFLILSAQFNSVTLPLVVMSAIPFGIIGMIWAFAAHGLPISFVGLIGLVGLSGVIVNDSIVMIDFIHNNRKNGMSAFAACLQAGRRRFRAVWLTTSTTVFGLLPMVYGLGGMDRFMRPAAVTMGYGLLFGTVLILFFVPAIYLMRDDIGRLLRRLLRLAPVDNKAHV